MKLVIDTSVAVKWFLDEPDHETAIALLETKATFLAPDLIFTEFATAMQKKIKLGETDRAQSFEICRSLPILFASITPTLLLFERALDLALSMNHPVQDCIFLACAERNGSRVVTADDKLIQRASDRGFGHLVFAPAEAVEAIALASRNLSISAAQIQSVTRLVERVETTFEGLRAHHAPQSEGFHFVPAEAYGAAFTSPAYIRLRGQIEALPVDQLYDLTALCWLGRGYDGADWSRLRAQAERTIGNVSLEMTYLLSLLIYLPAGLDRLRAAQPSQDTHRDI